MNSNIDSVPHCFGIKGGYHSYLNWSPELENLACSIMQKKRSVRWILSSNLLKNSKWTLNLFCYNSHLEKSSWLLNVSEYFNVSLIKYSCVGGIFFFSFPLKMQSILFLDKVSPQAHYYSEKWEMLALLRWFLSQEYLQLNFSLLFPLSMLLRTVPDLPVDSFTKQCTVPVAAREVGFCRDSPGVGSRGRSTWKFQNYSCSLVPLMRASSVHSLDLTGRSYWLQQLSQESKHFAALTYLWYIQET